MATPKKENKTRDRDRTRKKLLDIVGEILKDTGFTGLKTNNIAKRLGKDKNLIRYYFNSLYNLEKEFILEKDHWTAFFRKSALPPKQETDSVGVFLAALMHEHFEFFIESAEMQKVMLWQLTENSPLIKSIVQLREKEAERLLSAAGPLISSDPDFRAVLALLFGGLYFLSLQAAAGNGSTWGIDITAEKDRKAVLNVAERIIRLALAGDLGDG